MHVAAARCDARALRRLLGADRDLANAEGGPFGWVPLLCLAFARHDPAVSAEAVRASPERCWRQGRTRTTGRRSTTGCSVRTTPTCGCSSPTVSTPTSRWAGSTGVPRRSAPLAAAEAGHRATAALLQRLGATSSSSSVLAAVLAGEPVDEAELPAAIAARPGLVAWAAASGDRAGVRRAAELGWSVDRRARTDVPSDEEWETGLHAAAARGDLATVRLLLELGADPTVRDARFDATPAQWAAHAGHGEVAALLSGLSGRSG